MVAVFRYICNMLQKLSIIFLLLFTTASIAQIDSTFVDDKYLEDQIYFSFNYNLLVNKPVGFHQNSISGGFSVGFIKDIPLNKRRNVGVAIGLGYNYNAYNQNLKISENGTYEILENDNFNSNRFTSYIIEMPVEFRWRTSTAQNYRFWRIYAGVKFGYVFSNKSKFSDDVEVIKVKNIDEFQKIQYGLTLSAGYSTFNLNLYYGLNTLFKDAYADGILLDMKQINFGLIFYIL